MSHNRSARRRRAKRLQSQIGATATSAADKALSGGGESWFRQQSIQEIRRLEQGAEEKRQRQAAEEESRWLQREADLKTLIRAIEAIQTCTKHYQDTVGLNETRTRMALIDPLLCALGWDTSDPARVVPEYPAGGGSADYALLKMMSEREEPKPIAFIEAKRLNDTLNLHHLQMLNYANMSGVKYAGLTNGDRWEMYEVFKEAPLDDRRILSISLRQEPAFDCAVQLLQLARPALEAGEVFSPEEAQRLLFKAVGAMASTKVIGLLLDSGADCTIDLREGSTLLHWAVRRADQSLVTLLLDHGADIEVEDQFNRTPLHVASKESSTPMVVALLLARGANTAARDESGFTPLHWAALTNENVKIAEVLLNVGAEITAEDKEGKTPCYYAQWNKNEEVAALMRRQEAVVAAGEFQCLNTTALGGAKSFPGFWLSPESR